MRPVIKEVLRDEYGLHFTAVEDLGVGQAQTERFLVVTAEGRWIGKHYGAFYRNKPDWVAFECEMLSYLAAKDHPVANVRRTTDGRPFVRIAGRPFVVYEWAEGSIEWPASEPRAAKLGSALAQMHLTTDDMPIKGDARRYDIHRLIDRPIHLLRPFIEAEQRSVDALNLYGAGLRASLAEIPVATPQFGPIHGDVHQGNCFFGDDDALTMFDFALCGVGYRAYDLSGFLWPLRDATVRDPAMARCCTAFLEGYKSTRPLSAAEEAAIPAFVQIRSLWEMGDWIESGTGAGKPAEVCAGVHCLLEQFGSRPHAFGVAGPGRP